MGCNIKENIYNDALKKGIIDNQGIVSNKKEFLNFKKNLQQDASEQLGINKRDFQITINENGKINFSGIENLDTIKLKDINIDLSRLLALKRQRLNNLKRYLNSIKDLIKREKDEIKLYKLKDLEREYEKIILGIGEDPNTFTSLEKEVNNLQQNLNGNQKTLQHLRSHVIKDLQRLYDISQSEDYLLQEEADSIIKFYLGAGEIQENRTNVFFKDVIGKEDLAKKDLEEYKAFIYEVYQFVWEIRNAKVKPNLDNLYLDSVNKLRNIQKMYGRPLKIEDLIKTTFDKNIFSQYFLAADMSFSRNELILPGIMVYQFTDALKKNNLFKVDIIKRIKAIIKDLQKVIKEYPEQYHLFLEKDENGLYRDRIVERFKSSFLNKIIAIEKEYKNNLKKLEIERKDDREGLEKNYTEQRKKWYLNNTLFFNITDEEQLRKLLGEVGYKNLKKKQEQLREEYTKQYAYLKKRYKNIENGAQILAEWVIQNDPDQVGESLKKGNKFDHTLKYNVVIAKDEKNYTKNFKTIEENETLFEFYNIIEDIFEQIDHILPVELKKNFSFRSVPILRDIFRLPTFKDMLNFGSYIQKFGKVYFGKDYVPTETTQETDIVTGKLKKKIDTYFLAFSKQKIETLFNIYKQQINTVASQDIKEYYTEVDLTSNKALWEVFKDITGIKDEADFKKMFPKENIKSAPILSLIKAFTTNKVVMDKSMDLPLILTVFTDSLMLYKTRQEMKPILEYGRKILTESSVLSVNSQGEALYKDGERVKEEGQLSRTIDSIDAFLKRALYGDDRVKPVVKKLRPKTDDKILKMLNNPIDKIKNPLIRKNIEIIKEYLEKEGKGYEEFQKENKELDEREHIEFNIAVYKIEIELFLSGLDKVKKHFRDDTDKDIKQSIEKLKALYRDDSKSLLNDDSEESPLGEELLLKELKILKEKTDELKELDKRTGRVFSWVNLIDTLLKALRFKALAYNLDSQTTNLLEGQIANNIIASSGMFFSLDSYYKSLNIVPTSILKNFTGNKVKMNFAKKAAKMIEVFDLLQNPANVLQESNPKGGKFKTGLKKLIDDPFLIIKSTEYLNQMPLIISVFMDTKIKSKEGKESSVWDAMEDDKWELKEEFKTEENIKDWQEGKVDKSFKTKIDQMLAMIHADYRDHIGIKAKDSLLGKVIMMFRGFIPVNFFQRVAGKQDLVTAGIKDYKGYYRDMTTHQAIMHTILSITTLPQDKIPHYKVFNKYIGRVISSSAMLIHHVFFNEEKVKAETRSIKNTLKNLKALLIEVIRSPINVAMRRQIIKQTKIDWIENPSESTLGRIQMNFTELGYKLRLAAMTWGTAIILKELFKGDEDEDEDEDNYWVNLISNKLLSFSEQVYSYTDFSRAYDHIFAIDNIAALRLVTDITNFLDALFSKSNTYTRGVHRGENRVIVAAKKFLPGFLPHILGGSSSGSYSPKEFYIGKMLYPDKEKDAQRRMDELRARLDLYLKEELEIKGSSNRSKLITKVLPKREEGETIQERVDRVFSIEEKDYQGMLAEEITNEYIRENYLSHLSKKFVEDYDIDYGLAEHIANNYINTADEGIHNFRERIKKLKEEEKNSPTFYKDISKKIENRIKYINKKEIEIFLEDKGVQKEKRREEIKFFLKNNKRGDQTFKDWQASLKEKVDEFKENYQK